MVVVVWGMEEYGAVWSMEHLLCTNKDEFPPVV